MSVELPGVRISPFAGTRDPMWQRPLNVEVDPAVIKDAFSLETVEARSNRLFVDYTSTLEQSPEQFFEVRDPLKVGVVALGGMGGSGNVARQAANGMAQAGHTVHMFSSDDPFFVKTGPEPYGYVESSVPHTPKKASADWVAPLTEELIQGVKDHDLEILHVHYATGLLDAAMAAKEALAKEGRDIRVAVTLHGSDVTVFGQEPTYAKKMQGLLDSCDDVSCVSHVLAMQAERLLGLKRTPRIVENSVDVTNFRPGQWSNLRERIAPNGEVVFCHVSNYREVKRPLDALETFARVRTSGVQAKLLLVGDGPEMEKLYSRALELGVADDIVCAGPQPQHKLPALISASDLVLVTSLTESFCLAALEAMACGTPVVGTRCGGLDEIMEHVDRGADGESRLLADVGAVDRLAELSLELLGDPKRYEEVQRACIEAPLKIYPEDVQTRGYLSLLEDLREPQLLVTQKPRRPPPGNKSMLEVRVSQLKDHVASKKD